MSSFQPILEKFKQVTIDFDQGALPKDIQEAIPFIKEAMDITTEIYLKQQNEKLPEIYDRVLKGSDNERKTFYKFFLGPWDQLEGYKSLEADIGDRDPGCSFYPSDFSKERLEDYMASLPEATKEKFQDHYTVIRKKDNNNKTLEAIDYHEYYRADLLRVKASLEKAADKVENKSLKSYLLNRANHLVTGNYRESDSEWVQLKGTPLELIIGPYEVYADGLFGIKATYESMLMVVDQEKCDDLANIEANIGKLADVFPVPNESKPSTPKVAPIVVVHQIYTGGEACQGINASAFNLPNDPWVRGNVGWKQVMLFNIMEAKFNACTRKIGNKILGDDYEVAFDPYFYFVLLHEISHGLGPAYRKDGKEVNKCLGNFSTSLEELKADIGSLYLLQHLGGQYGIPKFETTELLNSFFAGLFRSMRFGVHEAHGASNVMQFNWFKDKGIIREQAAGRYILDSSNLYEETKALLDKVCEIQASASIEEAGSFVERYATPDQGVLQTLELLSDIPVDINPEYKLS